jgi:hypothetical protein
MAAMTYVMICKTIEAEQRTHSVIRPDTFILKEFGQSLKRGFQVMLTIMQVRKKEKCPKASQYAFENKDPSSDVH